MSSFVNVVFYTQSHRIVGDLLVTERLSEKLNDPLTDYIEMQHVKISSLRHTGQENVVQWEAATIPKSSILVATLDRPEHESRQSRIDKVQVKRGGAVAAIVGTIEVYGTGHLQFTGSATRVLNSQLQSFFPITDAMVILSQRSDDNRIETGLALVNRSMVAAFTLS